MVIFKLYHYGLCSAIVSRLNSISIFPQFDYHIKKKINPFHMVLDAYAFHVKLKRSSLIAYNTMLYFEPDQFVHPSTTCHPPWAYSFVCYSNSSQLHMKRQLRILQNERIICTSSVHRKSIPHGISCRHHVLINDKSRVRHAIMELISYLRHRGVSLHLVRSLNEFSWGCKFMDGVWMVMDLQRNLFRN